MFSIPVAEAAYSTSTAITDGLSAVSGVGDVIQGAVPAIIALMAALIGLGWIVSKFRKHVAGKKF